MANIEFIATTLLGIESITTKELRHLGIEYTNVEDGRITFIGDETTLCQSNIWLRTAERVYVKLGEFQATTFDQLFEGTKALPWENWITSDAMFPVNAYSLKSKLASVPDCQSIVKKAIVERLKKHYKKDWFEETGPSYKIQLALMKDRATLMIDTSGDGLHKRGYRENANEAPLKETLAAAMVYISNWRKENPFMDPFCGSGTIPIEAALIAKNIAPGLNRKFISQNWPQIKKEQWDFAFEQAKSKINNDVEIKITGSDISFKSVELARRNAEIAGLGREIVFKKFPVNEIRSAKDYGTIICNPPYGERMSEIKEVEKLYKEMGKVFSSMNSWSYFIITPVENFEELFGKKSDKNRKLYNGMIKCYFYQYFGPKPPHKTN